MRVNRLGEMLVPTRGDVEHVAWIESTQWRAADIPYIIAMELALHGQYHATIRDLMLAGF